MINNGIANMCSCIAKKEFKCVTLLFYDSTQTIRHSIICHLGATDAKLSRNSEFCWNAGVANTSSII